MGKGVGLAGSRRGKKEKEWEAGPRQEEKAREGEKNVHSIAFEFKSEV
jgi:hypothetical protein